jgi:hypothetical protein
MESFVLRGMGLQNRRQRERKIEKVPHNTRLLLRKDTQFFKKKALFVYGIKNPNFMAYQFRFSVRYLINLLKRENFPK